jgi:HK97 family phage major capsid protein
MEDAKKLKADAAQLKEILADGAEVKAALKAADDTHEADDALTLAQNKAKANGTAGPGKFKSWGEFLVSVHSAQVGGILDPRLNFVKYDDAAVISGERKDLLESVGASGGFLVPDEYLATLYSVMGEASTVRQRATRIPMRRRAIRIPVLDQTTTTAGVPHWFGGMTFAWAEEAASKTQSDPSFRQIELVAHKLIGYTRASDELLDDSAISLEAFLSGPMGFGGGAAWMEEFAFLQGTGAGQPLGVINAGATIVEGRFAANLIGIDDLADMVADFLPTGKGVWMITQSAMSTIIQLTGPAGNPSYIWQANARDGIPGMILGMPVIWTEKLPAMGTSGDIVLADWSYYLIGDRQATTVESTKFDRWRFDETSWRMVHRVDGQPWLSAPLTLQDGATQVSPFVILGTAAGGS